MSESKKDKSRPFDLSEEFSQTPTVGLPEDKHLRLNNVLSLLRTSKSHYLFYKPILDKKVATKLVLTYILQGEVPSLLEIIKNHPFLLFEEYPEITGPGGERYFNITPNTLLKFLSDRDMTTQVLLLIPKHFNSIRQKQLKEMDCGGADLIKLDQNPLEILDFNDLIQFKKTYLLFNERQEEVTIFLLGNPDGIICHEKDGEKHFYYVNKDRKEIKPLDICLQTPEDTQEFEHFKSSFDTMEDNSSRRSSNKEYQLIIKILQCTLVRKGIQYELNGTLFCDSEFPFNNLINTYRTSLRFYEEAAVQGNDSQVRINKAETYWFTNLGKAQAQSAIWILQRFCEKNKSFFSFSPTHFNDFTRCLKIYNNKTGVYKPLLVRGVVLTDLGSIFALYKGKNGATQKSNKDWWRGFGLITVDLVAICRLVEDAKKNVIEFKQEPESQTTHTIFNQKC